MRSGVKIGKRMIAMLSIMAVLTAFAAVLIRVSALNDPTKFMKDNGYHLVKIYNFTPDKVTVDASETYGSDSGQGFVPEYGAKDAWREYNHTDLTADERNSSTDAVYWSQRDGYKYTVAEGYKSLIDFVNIKFTDLKDGYVPVTFAMTPDAFDWSLKLASRVDMGEDSRAVATYLPDAFTQYLSMHPEKEKAGRQYGEWAAPVPSTVNPWEDGEENGQSNDADIFFSFSGLEDIESGKKYSGYYPRQEIRIVTFAVPYEANSMNVTVKSTEGIKEGLDYRYADTWKAEATITNSATYPMIAWANFSAPTYDLGEYMQGTWSIENTGGYSLGESSGFILPGKKIKAKAEYNTRLWIESGNSHLGRVLPNDTLARAEVTVDNMFYRTAAGTENVLTIGDKTVTKKFTCFFSGNPESAQYDPHKIRREAELSVTGSLNFKYNAVLETHKSVSTIEAPEITLTGGANLANLKRIVMTVRTSPGSYLRSKVDDELKSVTVDGYKKTYEIQHRLYSWLDPSMNDSNSNIVRRRIFTAKNGEIKTLEEDAKLIPTFQNKFTKEVSGGKCTITFKITGSMMRDFYNSAAKDSSESYQQKFVSYFDFYLFYDYQRDLEVSWDSIMDKENGIAPDFYLATRGTKANSSGGSTLNLYKQTSANLYDPDGKTFALIRPMNKVGLPDTAQLTGSASPTLDEMRYKALSFTILRDDIESFTSEISTSTDPKEYTWPDGSKRTAAGRWYRLEGETIRINESLVLARDRIGEGGQITLTRDDYGVFIFIGSDNNTLVVFSRGYMLYPDTSGVNLMGDIYINLQGHRNTWYASQYNAGNFMFKFGSEKEAMKNLVKVKITPQEQKDIFNLDDPVLNKIITGNVTHVYPYQTDCGLGISMELSASNTIQNFLPFIPDALMDFGIRQWCEEHGNFSFSLDEFRIPYVSGLPIMKFSEPLSFTAVAPLFLFEAGGFFEFDADTRPEAETPYISVKGGVNLFDQFDIEGELVLAWKDDGMNVIPDRLALGFASDLLGLPPEISIVALEKIRASIDNIADTFAGEHEWDLIPPISVSLNADLSVKLDAKATEIALKAKEVGVTVSLSGIEMGMGAFDIEAFGITVNLLEDVKQSVSYDLDTVMRVYGADKTVEIPCITFHYLSTGSVNLSIENTPLQNFVKGTSTLQIDLSVAEILTAINKILFTSNMKGDINELADKLETWKNGDKDVSGLLGILTDTAKLTNKQLADFVSALTVKGEANGRVIIPDCVPVFGGKTIAKGRVSYGVSNAKFYATAYGSIDVLGVEASITASFDLRTSKIEWDVSAERMAFVEAGATFNSQINNSYAKTVTKNQARLMRMTGNPEDGWTFTVAAADEVLAVELYAGSPSAATLRNGDAVINITDALALYDGDGMMTANGWVADYGDYIGEGEKPQSPIGYRYTVILKKDDNLGSVGSTWTVSGAGLSDVTAIGLVSAESITGAELSGNSVSFTLSNSKSLLDYAATVVMVPAADFDADGNPTSAGVSVVRNAIVNKTGVTQIEIPADSAKLLANGSYKIVIYLSVDSGEPTDSETTDGSAARYFGLGISAVVGDEYTNINPLIAGGAPVLSAVTENAGYSRFTVSAVTGAAGYTVMVYNAADVAVNANVGWTEDSVSGDVTVTVFYGKGMDATYYAVVTPYFNNVDPDSGVVLARLDGTAAVSDEFGLRPEAVAPTIAAVDGVNYIETVTDGDVKREIYMVMEEFIYSDVEGETEPIGAVAKNISLYSNLADIGEWNVTVTENYYGYEFQEVVGEDETTYIKVVAEERSGVSAGTFSGDGIDQLIGVDFEILCGNVYDWLSNPSGKTDRSYEIEIEYFIGEVSHTRIIEIRIEENAPLLEVSKTMSSYDGKTLVLAGKADAGATLSLRYRYTDAEGNYVYVAPEGDEAARLGSAFRRSGESFTFNAEFIAALTAETVTRTETTDEGSATYTSLNRYYFIDIIATAKSGAATVSSLMFYAGSDYALTLTTSLDGAAFSVGMRGIELFASFGNAWSSTELADGVSYQITEGQDKLRLEADGTLTAIGVGEAVISAQYTDSATTYTAKLRMDITAEGSLPVELVSSTHEEVTISVGALVGLTGRVNVEISTDGSAFTKYSSVAASAVEQSLSISGLEPMTKYYVRLSPGSGSGFAVTGLTVFTSVVPETDSPSGAVEFTYNGYGQAPTVEGGSDYYYSESNGASWTEDKPVDVGEYLIRYKKDGSIADAFGFSIVPAAATITFNGATVKADGSVKNIAVSQLPIGVTVKYYVGGSEFTGAAAAGTYEITAKFSGIGNYTGIPESLTATLKIIEIESLRIKTAPQKTTYKAGETFDTTGLIIEAVYTDGTAETLDLTAFTLSNTGALAIGTQKITLTHTVSGKTLEIPITVEKAEKSTGCGSATTATLPIHLTILTLCAALLLTLTKKARRPKQK